MKVAPKLKEAFAGGRHLDGGEVMLEGVQFEASILEFSFQHLVSKPSQLLISKLARAKRLRHTGSLGLKREAHADAPHNLIS